MSCNCCTDKRRREKLATKKTSISYHAMHGNLSEVRRMIKAGVDVNLVEGDLDETPLMLASSHGHLPVVKALIDAGADHSYEDRDRLTAVFLACQGGHESVVSALLESGAEMELSCGKGESLWTPLTAACSENHLEVVKVLLRAGADVEKCPCDDGLTAWSPLVFACTNENLECVDELIKHGASIDRHIGKNGTTALTMACMEGQLAVVQKLVQAGASLVEQSHDESPLVRAARGGADSVVEYLLSVGAEVDSPLTGGGETALMIAAQEDHINIVRRLLMAGANVNHGTAEGCTALYYAAETSSAEMAELLLSAGAFVDVRGKKTKTPLLFAIIMNNIEAARVLVSAGADVNARGEGGLYPLSFPQSSRVVTLLLKNGAKVDSRDEHGNNALHYALANGRDAGILISLLRGGCDPYALNDIFDTPMQVGMRFKHVDAVKCFGDLLAVFEAGGVHALPPLCDSCEDYPARACGGCGQAYYCGVKCQKECWAKHKVACKALSKN